VRVSGRAHRPRVRDRAVPSASDGAIDHGDCATLILHVAPVRRRLASACSREADWRARPRATHRCAGIGDRHAVEHELALLHENHPADLLHARRCRALGRALRTPCRMRSRAQRREFARHGASHEDAVRAHEHVCMLRWLFNLLQLELPVGYHDHFTSTRTAYACSNCCLLGSTSSTRASASASTAH